MAAASSADLAVASIPSPRRLLWRVCRGLEWQPRAHNRGSRGRRRPCVAADLSAVASDCPGNGQPAQLSGGGGAAGGGARGAAGAAADGGGLRAHVQHLGDDPHHAQPARPLPPLQRRHAARQSPLLRAARAGSRAQPSAETNPGGERGAVRVVRGGGRALPTGAEMIRHGCAHATGASCPSSHTTSRRWPLPGAEARAVPPLASQPALRAQRWRRGSPVPPDCECNNG